MGNRKAFTKYVVEQIDEMERNAGVKEPKNGAYLREKLESLSDAEFEALVTAIEEGKAYLPFFMPNDVDTKLKIDKWIKQAEREGADLFTKLRVEDPATGQVYRTNEKFWVALLNSRRQIQFLDSKRSLAKDNKSRDVITGQVAGASKGSSLSPGQTALMTGRGMKANALELLKARGGDVAAGRELNRALIENGSASLENIIKMNSAPSVNHVVASYLNSIHIAHNILDKNPLRTLDKS